MEHLVSTKTDPASSTSEGVGTLAKSDESIYLNAIITRLLFPLSPSCSSLLPAHVSPLFVPKRKKKLSTRGKEKSLVFGCWLLFFTFIAARASYFTCFLFIYEFPSVVLHFPSSLSIFLSTSKYHFPSPPISLCSRKRVDVSRSQPTVSLYSKWSCSASTGREKEKSLPFRTSIPPVYATSPSIILLSRKNSTNEPNLSDQKRNAQILSLVSQLPPTFFFLSSSLFPSDLFHCPSFYFMACYHLPVFYLPAQFIPVYRHFVSSPTQEARKTILKSGIRCLTGGVWGDCNIGGIWLWDNRDSFSLSFFFLFLLLSFDFTTFAFILFGSFLPWGTLGFDTGLINFSLSFYFFDVPRILSFIRLLCFGG